MTALIGSPFLQALGWAIAGSLWQMALLWVAYQLCFLAWRNARASARTAAATALLFTGFIWFICSMVRHYWDLKTASPSISTDLSPNAAYAFAPFILHGHALIDYVNAGLLWVEPYLPYLSSAYLLMLAFLLVRVGKAYRHVQAVRTEGLTRIDGHWRVYVQEMANRIGIHKKIRIWLSDRIDIPATMGYLKPLILLPITSFNQLTSEQVEAIILHELAHIRRHDYLLNLVITVLDTILFFNPFAQLITRHIRTERENSCDDFVLQFRYNPHTYASALLSLERQRLSPELAMAASGKSDLLDRIKRILNVPAKPMNYGQKLMALLITAGILASLAWLTPDHVQHKPILSRVVSFLPAIVVPDPPVPAPAVARDRVRVKGKNSTCGKTGTGKFKNDVITFDETIFPPVPVGPPCPANQGIAWSRTWTSPLIKDQDWANTVMVLADTCKYVVMDSLRGALLDLAKAAEDGQDNEQKVIALVHISGLMAHKALALQNLKFKQNLDYAQEKMLLDTRRAMEKIQLQQEQSRARCEQAELRQEQQVPKLKILDARARLRVKARVLDQQPDDDITVTGILADQPGWQSPAAPRKATAITYKVVPNQFRVFPANYRDDNYNFNIAEAQKAYTTAMNTYKERVTLFKGGSQDVLFASVNNFMNQLEADGAIPEGKNVRIIRNSKTLTINGKALSDADCARYQHFMDGKSLIIISTGKTLQVTVK